MNQRLSLAGGEELKSDSNGRASLWAQGVMPAGHSKKEHDEYHSLQLQEGANQLEKACNQLQEGANQLQEGANQLQKECNQVQEGANQLQKE